MPEPSSYLNGLELGLARRELLRCCGSERWVSEMVKRRPFQSADELKQLAREIWSSLGREDYLQAFAQHPEIGADMTKLREKFGGPTAGPASTSSWSSAEQAGVNGASEGTLGALRDANLAYKARFGFIFIVCATGKSAEEMLALLRARLANDPERELQVAAQEQAKITELRLEKLGT